MSECQTIQSLLAESNTLSDLSPSQQQHMQQCPHCQSYWQQLQRINTSLTNMGQQSVPADLSQRLLNISAPQKEQTASSWGWKQSIAASIAVLVSAFSLWDLGEHLPSPINQELAWQQAPSTLAMDAAEPIPASAPYASHPPHAPSKSFRQKANVDNVLARPMPASPQKTAVLNEAQEQEAILAEAAPVLSDAPLERRVAKKHKEERSRRTASEPAMLSFGDDVSESDRMDFLEEELMVEAKVAPAREAAENRKIVETREPMDEASLYTQPGAKLDAKTNTTTPAFFWRDLEDTSVDSFFRPSGYWENSYVPGDPDIRILEANLKQWSNQPGSQPLIELPQLLTTTWQPFDPPSDAALGLYLSTDKAGVDAPQRVRLQIGLKGSARQSGQRSPMNIGLLIQHHQLRDKSTTERLSKLIQTFHHMKQSGDQFVLVVSGTQTPAHKLPQLRSDDLRYGSVHVFFEQSRGFAPSPADVYRGYQQLSATLADMAKEHPLSTNLALLTLDKPLRNASQMKTQAHANVLNDISTSAIALTPSANNHELERLVIAGHGNRRIFHHETQADKLVKAELFDASRTVAKAIRLQIELAKQVQLVDIWRSQPLDQHQSERIKQAERHVDQQLQRELGISANRGDDDPGIQIVIPKFMANDDHVILLDLLVPHGGQLAQVSAKYKDLVNLKNGEVHQSIAIANHKLAAGPIQYNVQQNIWTHYFSEQLDALALLLKQSNKSAATHQLEALANQASQLRLAPAWQADNALPHDIQVLNAYLQHLRHSDIDLHKLGRSMEFSASQRLRSIQP
jgi:hypothetical protein